MEKFQVIQIKNHILTQFLFVILAKKILGLIAED